MAADYSTVPVTGIFAGLYFMGEKYLGKTPNILTLPGSANGYGSAPVHCLTNDDDVAIIPGYF